VDLFHMLRNFVIIACSVWLLSFLTRRHRFFEWPVEAHKVFLFSLAALWLGIHNPGPVSVFNRDMNVVWSIGCPDADREILVQDGQRYYIARGTAVEGDYVELDSRRFKSRFALVETNGYASPVGRICALFEDARVGLHHTLSRFPQDIRSWMSGFLLGRSGQLDKNLVDSFRRVGLMHVLVLSGSHLSVLAAAILLVLRLPGLLLYLFKHLSVRSWVIYWTISSMVAALSLFSFCVVVGFTQTVQRAFLGFFVCNVASMVGLAHDTKTRIKLIFGLQSILFPVNLLSLSLMLSWSGAFVLQAFYESTYLKSKLECVVQIVKIQLVFFAMTLIFFGEAGVLSPVVNVLALPLVSVLLPLDMVAIFLDHQWINSFIVELNRLFLTGVKYVDLYQASLPITTIKIPSGLTIESTYGRLVIAMIVSTLFLLAGLRQSTKAVNLKPETQ
jgi:predicted membrane metal-binding protein